MRTKALALAIFLIVWFLLIVLFEWLPFWVTLGVLALLLLDFVFGGERTHR